MKIEWTAEDITPGRVVGKPDRNERWMIGYFGDAERGQEDRYALVSTTDGMIGLRMGAQGLATQLNKSGEIPAEFIDSPQSKGGKNRAASLTSARRSEIASSAAQARWNGGTKA